MRAFLDPRAVATVAALAVALVGVLPAEHLHADADHADHADGPVVHRHVIDGGSHHGSMRDDRAESVDHDDHASAHFLSATYVATSRFSAYPVPPPAHLTHLTHPLHLSHLMHPLHLTHPLHPLPTHDPPLSFISSPAPPPPS